MTSRNVIARVTCSDGITLFNITTRQIRRHPDIHDYGYPKFFDQFQSIISLNKIKAIIFGFVGNEFSTFLAEHQFRLECREFCQKNGIYCWFPSPQFSEVGAALTETQTMVKEGETVLLLTALLPGRSPICITVKRGKDNYQVIKVTDTPPPPFSPSWKAGILGSLKPAKVILSIIEDYTDLNDIHKLGQLFKNENFTIYSFEPEFNFRAEVSKILNLIDEKVNQYDIGLYGRHLYEVRVDGKILIQNDNCESLPFEKSAILDVDPVKSVMLYAKFYDFCPFQLFEEIMLSSFKSKQVKITLKLDYNSFYDLQVEPYDGKSVDENKADKHDVELEKARMVFDKQHFSVLCFADGNENILKDKDGLTKTPIYISFNEAKPIIGKSAIEIYSEKPKFVVFDLIKLCSVTSTNDIFSSNWGFRLSKEDESIMVIMQTSNEERKSSAAFLLALILKNGVDRIKKEYGRKVEEIEIGFDDFVPNETLKKNFIKAGNLLKIGIAFV